MVLKIDEGLDLIFKGLLIKSLFSQMILKNIFFIFCKTNIYLKIKYDLPIFHNLKSYFPYYSFNFSIIS